MKFRQSYDLTVLAVNRHGQTFIERLSDLELIFGDVLLVQGKRTLIDPLVIDRELMLLEDVSAKRKYVTWTKQAADVRANIPGWMPTDLRRTLTTIATNMKLSGLVVKRLLNHTTEPVEGDVTAGYYVSDVEFLREPVADTARKISRMALAAEEELRRELEEGGGLPQWLQKSSPRGKKRARAGRAPVGQKRKAAPKPRRAPGGRAEQAARA